MTFHIPTFLKTFVATLVAAAIASPKFGNLKADATTVGVAVLLAALHAMFPSFATSGVSI